MKNKLNYLFVLHFLNDGFLASIILLLPFIKQSLDLNLTQIGVLSTILSISGIILALPAGHFGHKIGALKVLSVALFFYALGFFSIGISSSFLFLIFSFIIASLGFSIFHPISFSLVSKWTDPKKIGRTMGDFTAFGDVGRIVLSSSIPLIIIFLGWRNTSFLYASISLVFLFLFTYLQIINDQKVKEEKKVEMNMFLILKNRKFAYALLISFFDNLASSALFAFLPFLLLKKNINLSLLGAFSGAFLIGNLLGKAGLGRLADKFENTKIFIIAEFLMAVFIFLLTLSNNQFLIISFSIMLGTLTAGTIPVRTTFITESTYHLNQHEKIFSIASLVETIAKSLAPIILGRVADIYGIFNSFYTAALFAIIALIPAFLFFKLKTEKNTLLY